MKDEKILIGEIRKYLPEKEIKRIKDSLQFAKKAHQRQKRLSGEDYIVHPLFVAKILAELKLDSSSIVAAILHDVIEDTEIKAEEIEKKFGKDVSEIVLSLTKLKKITLPRKKLNSDDQRAMIQINALRQVFFAMAKDLRIVIIKIIDRLHNIKSISVFPRKKQKSIAKETLYIYAPLASRLGMGKFKAVLEDASFKIINPKKYCEIEKRYQTILSKAEENILRAEKIVRQGLEKEGIKAEMHSRVKNIYSIHKKLIKTKNNYQGIVDLLGIRIIVKSKEECYKVLGIIHSIYQPIPNQFSDYIALPKLNGYQSIQTIVRVSDNLLLEFQIRTKKMDYQANFGVASHFVYTDDLRPKNNQRKRSTFVSKKELKWIQELALWQKKIKDQNKFIKELKIDFFNDRIFVFTPKGDVKDLPKGSTPVDFAYSVHTEIGNKTSGAKVDGILRPLNHKLKDGETVEIIINKKQKGPNSDWLEFVKSTDAKERIRSRINALKKINQFLS